MTWFVPEIIKETARSLRKNTTESEKLLWKELNNKKINYKFLRQKPIYLFTENSWLDRYVIPDFCSLELKLIIEVDGEVHNSEEVYLLDLEKEKLLNQKWFKVLRIRNDEIQKDINLVLSKIKSSFP
jgi:very-short-patch-repair endonuclease